MKNNFFTRLFLALVFLFEPVAKVISWIIWILSEYDSFNSYNNFKGKMIEKLFDNK